MDSSFTDNEKRFVLAEMIKVSPIDVGALVNFVRSYNFQPDWFSMQLPNGRNMNQCMQAAESMGMVYLQPLAMPPIKRKSLSDLNEPSPKRLAMTPIEPQPITYPRNVNIQPRPSPNGFIAPPPVSSPTVQSGNTVRKRGRPSKADKEAQARANAPASFPPPLAPAPSPLAPHPAPSTAQDYGANAPTTYHTSPGPVEPKSKKKGRPSSTDKSHPRALPDNLLEQAEKSPALGNLITPPAKSPVQRDSPAVHEAGRKLSGTLPSSQAPTSVMEHIRSENQTTVNTKA